MRHWGLLHIMNSEMRIYVTAGVYQGDNLGMFQGLNLVKNTVYGPICTWSGLLGIPAMKSI
jgi:hypothetical protein